jgi:DNA gyrase/topoisomerase IV subunit A
MLVNIVIVTKKGVITKFDSKELKAQHRNGRGIKAIMLDPDDEVVSAFVVEDIEVNK